MRSLVSVKFGNVFFTFYDWEPTKMVDVDFHKPLYRRDIVYLIIHQVPPSW